MALQVRGIDILSQGEFSQLVHGLDDSAPSPLLAAWFAGEDVEPSELHDALDVACRLASRTPQARGLIDIALARLARAYPSEVPA